MIRKTVSMLLFFAVVSAWGVGTAELQDTSIVPDNTNWESIKINWSAFHSEVFNVSIHPAPELELSQIPRGYRIKCSSPVDRVLYLDSGYSGDYSNSRLFYADYTKDEFIISETALIACYAQVGNVLYHYRIPLYAAQGKLTASYATVMYQDCDEYLATGYRITASGWFYMQGEYQLCTLESGNLCAVIDINGNPFNAYVFIRENWTGTISMYPFRKAYYSFDIIDDSPNIDRKEYIIPATLSEIEENWAVTFPYEPQRDLPDGMNVESDDDLLSLSMTNPGFQWPKVIVDGNMIEIINGFDSVARGYDTFWSLESYDGKHLFLDEGTSINVKRGNRSYEFEPIVYEYEQLLFESEWTRFLPSGDSVSTTDYLHLLEWNNPSKKDTDEQNAVAIAPLEFTIYYDDLNIVRNGIQLAEYSISWKNNNNIMVAFLSRDKMERIEAYYNVKTGELSYTYELPMNNCDWGYSYEWRVFHDERDEYAFWFVFGD